ncbi:MAG: hypothetical protein J6Z49_12010 [Kiritimatiellae bacterium]|nr:hypothetical protein [Kiritimatiellia bacterium]
MERIVSFFRKQGTVFAAVAAVAAAVALYAFAVGFGPLNQDEGWYLYAARSVAEGKTLYRDFFFTQGPVLPAVYGAFHALWQPFGVLGGRLFTAFLGILSCFFAAALAARSLPPGRRLCAAVTAFAFTGCNLYHAYFTSIPKTYALASLFVLGGFLLLTFCDGKGAGFFAFFGGFLVAVGAGTRVSLILLLPPAAFGLLMMRRRYGFSWLWFGVGATAGVAAVYAVPLLASTDSFLFAQTFHVTRGGRNLALSVGALSRIVRGYFPLVALTAAVALLRFLRSPGGETAEPQESRSPLPLFWLVCAAAVFLFQLASPHPYDDYQVPVMGLFAAAAAAWCAERGAAAKPDGRLALVAVLFAGLTAFSTSQLQEWFVIRQDRFWTLMREKSDLAQLREVGRQLRTLAPKGGVLLTQDAYLAVESGLVLPPGLEMGPFSYFPDDEEAVRHRVVNRDSLRRLLEEAPGEVCAYSGYGWAIASPVMTPVPDAERRGFLEAIERRYEEVAVVPDFGQNKTALRIMKRKP